MTNLSQQRRKKMLEFLDELKAQNTSDDKALRAIGEIENELNSKKYGLVWEQHEEAIDVKIKDFIPVFTEDNDREITCDDSGQYNFLLEGDNLHSLKLLEKTHRGAIDVIYIDPPYNLGQDFIYDDSCVDTEDGYRHSKWLSFMNERLKAAKNLLSDTGCILISINDAEYAGLKLLCDNIFSEMNFQCTFIWKSRQRADSRNINMISNDHEYILLYSVSNKFKFIGTSKDISKYKNPDNDPRGPWASIDLSGLADASRRPNLHYDIVNPETGIHYPPNPNRGWSKSKENVQKMIEEKRILWPSSPKGRPREKKFLSSLRSEYTGFSSVLNNEDVGYTTDGTRSLNKILGSKVFNYPKSVKLLKTLLSQFPSSSCTVLDFFAGSGTTAQAVLELNQEDGGDRHFILCTNNENNICENVTYPRVKTVITGIRPDGSRYSDGIPANLKYYKTDFVSRSSDDLAEDLQAHAAEMIQLEYGIKLDQKHYLMILTDEEADNITSHWSDYPDVKAVYISHNVLLTGDEEKILSNTPTYVIPDYYFDFELREEGELW